MKLFNDHAGKLEMIIGCMLSCKSSTLISKIRQHKVLGRNILVINHVSDIRYRDKSICTHDNISIDAIPLETLNTIFDNENYGITNTIFIEEAQFFTDLYEFVMKAVEKDNKHVILCGLDGDYQRKPFMQIMNLIPMADIVERKNALCIKCRDGTIASFSKRIVEGNERNMIGGIETYMPVCRYHYHEI
jgi:thymidine kinase